VYTYEGDFDVGDPQITWRISFSTRKGSLVACARCGGRVRSAVGPTCGGAGRLIGIGGG
jgi:hypothetical protein